MQLPISRAEPYIMHIDLNSCFATIEQCANPLLRGKPIGVAAYASPRGCIVAPSIEAKKYGVKTGMTIRDGLALCPKLIIRLPDPPKYRDVHLRFKKIFTEYSDTVIPKSIDEAIIDFSAMAGTGIDLVKIGYEIKRRLKEEISEWMTCNVGIGPNRFLAKTAASLHKPDGLDVITYKNLEEVYSKLALTDLCGINKRYEYRLNVARIFNTTQFLKADADYLKQFVFQSVHADYWYKRLRGYEIDDVNFATKSFGQMYSIKGGASTVEELEPVLYKLIEKAGRRLRRHGSVAHGIHIFTLCKDGYFWHQQRLQDVEMYTTLELYKGMWRVFSKRPQNEKIFKIGVSFYDLEPKEFVQARLFEDTDNFLRLRTLSDTVDKINDEWGEFVVRTGKMLNTEDLVVDRISFGGVKELEDLYLYNQI